MTSDFIYILKIIVAFLPFLLLILANGSLNKKKLYRARQFFMPAVALVYVIVLFILMDKVSAACLSLVEKVIEQLVKWEQPQLAETLRSAMLSKGVLILFILFNTLSLTCFVVLKRLLLSLFCRNEIPENSLRGRIVGIFYEYDRKDGVWYILPHLGQARTFLKTAYRGGVVFLFFLMLLTLNLVRKERMAVPFYPVFPILVLGELAFFTDGLRPDEQKSSLSVYADRATRVALYPLLRRPLRILFGDKLSSEGTTVNNGSSSGGSVEDILVRMEETGGHLGKNYSAFIRTKMKKGLKPNVDYVRSGYELSLGSSLLFNTPFYDKLIPYAPYAMHRSLLQGGKVLVVLGRHGTTEDLAQWCRRSMLEVSNVPNLWSVEELTGKRNDDQPLPDIGIISRSAVHDLEIHRSNMEFLKQVRFVFIVEPSRLVATAQIGLNLLIKCCGRDRGITFCSVDQNCDGLVDSLSHILMANITEVSATEYPPGLSSYMCWTPDGDALQHRMLPGVSRYLGMGTELSFVALQNQVDHTVWYGGEAYPVLDARWIAKQYYYDLLDYAHLPTTQETFDQCFQASYNMCNEPMSDFAYICVEDERNNVFETKRNFSTIASKQGFVNVISSEYMLREYMTENTGLFNADPKAVPYITADYARTKRNAILTLCLRLCVDGVSEDELCRELLLIGLDSRTPKDVLWTELCHLFCGEIPQQTDREGSPIISLPHKDGVGTVAFLKSSTICFTRKYSVESGQFESIYTIENQDFAKLILDDLQNAGYIAERDSEDHFIGTELKGHIYQKYLPSQFFTLGGKYYEMISVTSDNRILVRRASEHIHSRLTYRQVRHYTLHRLDDAQSMGSLKTVNNIDIYYQFADLSVKTPAYWKLNAYNDFKNGQLVELNGVPERRYFHKQILKLDFSKLGDAFTQSVKLTLTNLLNEVFVTLFADNQPFISAVCRGAKGLPLTYHLEGAGDPDDQCIYIIEDSQLDIGLLIAVERNLQRILQIISDYLLWNEEMIQASLAPPPAPPQTSGSDGALEAAVKQLEANGKKPGIFRRIGRWFKRVFQRIGGWFKRIFSRKKKQPITPVPPAAPTPTAPEPAVPVPDPAVPDPAIPDPAIPDPVIPDPAIPDPVVPDPADPIPALEASEEKEKKNEGGWFKFFKKKKEQPPVEPPEPKESEEKKGFGSWFKFFKKKKEQPSAEADVTAEEAVPEDANQDKDEKEDAIHA